MEVQQLLKVINPKKETADVPLIVDVDGTLIHGDLLYEVIALSIKQSPVQFIKHLPLLFKGKALFKEKIFQLVDLDYTCLPYNRELIEFLVNEALSGRNIILATASPTSAAREISKVHPLFTTVFGTENNINLKGKNKLDVLVNNFGSGNFDYIGNSNADRLIFSSSRYAYLVNPTKRLIKSTGKDSHIKNIWQTKRASLRDYFKEMRLYQWIKNILVFIPLLTSHSFYSLPIILTTFVAFISFGLVSSSGYLINDILDINSDRHHQRKFQRPIASGKISIPSAGLLSVLLLCSGAIIASRLNMLFLYTLLAYYITSISYSWFLKKLPLYDVFVLAGLYSVRVFAGSVIIHVTLSFWLFAFSTFIFLSLAFLKRYTEMIAITDGDDLKKLNRGYLKRDAASIQVMGIASGFLAIIVFALYINSEDVTRLYAHPSRLWLICFLFLFWISHIWLRTSREKMTDDPIVFALKDINSYLILIATLILITASL